MPKATLDSAVIHFGETPRWHGIPFPIPKDMDAVTVGHDIYMRKGVYDPSTAKGLAFLAHELFHVDQYRTKSMSVLSYLREAKKNGGGEQNKYEEPAWSYERAVERQLRSVGRSWDGSLIMPKGEQ